MTQRIAGALVIFAAIVAGPGCMSLGHKPIALSSDCLSACNDVPCSCRGHVYVFLLSGFDPLDLDRVGDVRAALVRAGYTKIYNGQFYHEGFFASEMLRLSHEEPDTRFVLVGFSLGAESALSLAESVGTKGVPIALLASIDPYWWSSAPAHKPGNVEQVLHVHGERLLFAPAMSAGSDVQIAGSFPANVTAQPLAVEAVARAITDVAGQLPRPPAPVLPRIVNDSPSPRPVARTKNPPDAWDFLKPVAKLPPIALPTGEERTSLRPVAPTVMD
jgi:pimeloyl-ACP methyl ester carboxylesterase